MDQATVVVDQEGEASSKEGSHTSIECPVCLQICVHPVRLPCKHVFCYLCVKGVANRSKCCAMCRREIPQDYLTNPALISEEQVQIEAEKCDGHQWYYEGWNGWWQYDARASMELEEKFNANHLQSFELLIAGFLYVIDFENMIQYRRNDPSRRRRIKRDLSTITKKGVAGLKINQKKSSQLGSTSNISNEVIPNIREVERAQAEGTEADNIAVTVQSNIPVQNIAAISNMSTTNNGRFCPPVSTRAYRRLNRHTNENIPRYTNTNRPQTSISTSDLAENLSALSLEPHRPEGSEFVSEQAPDGATNSDNLPRTIPAVPYTGYNSGSINGSASGSMSGFVPSRRRQNNAPPGDSTLDE